MARRSALATLAVLLGLVIPAAAGATTVEVSGGAVRVSAGPGEGNDVRVDYDREGGTVTYIVSESAAALAVGPAGGCVVDGSRVRCTVPVSTSVVVVLGEGGDEATVSTVPETVGQVSGGDGGDALYGYYGRQRIDGGPGNDYMTDDTDEEVLSSAGPPSADELIGGPGQDTADYDDRPGPIIASLDDVADDGHPGEGDNIHADIEILYGTFDGRNFLAGNDGDNLLRGGYRSDVLVAGGGDDGIGAQSGDDVLDGGDGSDFLFGHDGDDSLTSGAGDDKLEGGAGNDRLDGGGGKDEFIGDVPTGTLDISGNDVILARDGIGETISCGPGADHATVDLADIVPTDPVNACEVVDRPPQPQAAPPRPPPFVSMATKGLRVSKCAVRIRLTCARATPCRGKLTLRSAKKLRVRGKQRILTLGSASFNIRARKSKAVTIKLGRTARRALRGKRSLSVTATAQGKDGSSTATFTLRLR